jgi:signal transduction histidine kinase
LRSFVGRNFAYVVGALLCVQVFFVLFGLQLQNTVNSGIKEREFAESKVLELSQNIAPAVSVYDLPQIERLVATSSLAKQSPYVGVFDADGSTMFDTATRQCPSGMKESSFPIHLGNALKGTIRTCIDKGESRAGIYIAWGLCVALCGIIALIVFLVSKEANSKLVRLNKFILELDKPQAERSSLPLRRGPMANVYNSITRMTAKLDTLVTKREKVKADSQKAEVLSGLAHDIRSPLSALKVIGSSKGLDETRRASILHKTIQRIEQISGKILNLKNDLSAEPQVFSILLTLQEIIQQRGGAKLVFEPFVSVADSFVKGCESDFYRAIVSVLNNATEACSSEDSVHVSLTKQTEYVKLKIADQGIGMDSQQLKRALEGGFSSKDKGSGIGLSSAVSFLEKWNGKVVVDSEVGQGTVVSMLFPVISKPNFILTELPKPKNYLFIEDDPGFREALRALYPDSAVFSPDDLGGDMEQAMQGKLLVVDYHLGKNLKGTEWIKQYAEDREAIIMSNLYQSSDLQESCILAGLRLIPKQQIEG